MGAAAANQGVVRDRTDHPQQPFSLSDPSYLLIREIIYDTINLISSVQLGKAGCCPTRVVMSNGGDQFSTSPHRPIWDMFRLKMENGISTIFHHAEDGDGEGLFSLWELSRAPDKCGYVCSNKTGIKLADELL